MVTETLAQSGLRLTPRDREIVELLLRACSDREIAQALGISIRTVKGHLQAMYWKNGIADPRKDARVVLAVMCYRAGLRARSGPFAAC
jgi:DNA-binding NarL/FixJ family response regulator